MSADIYTKGFTDKVLFGRLKQMINVFSPEQRKEFNFSPEPTADDANQVLSNGGSLQSLNLQHHFILSGDNTDTTDFRKPVKLKTPKAKSKIKRRPAIPLQYAEDGDDEDNLMDSSPTGGQACPCISTAANVDVSFLGSLGEDKWRLFSALSNFADEDEDDTDIAADDLKVSGKGPEEDVVKPPELSKFSEFSKKPDVSHRLVTDPHSHCEGATGGDSRPSETTAQAKLVHEELSKAPDDPAIQWTVILLCTEPNSLMVRENPFPRNCQLVEITKDDDFTSESGADKVRLALRGPKAVNSEAEKVENNEISVSKEADVIPAKEEKPDQSILNKPAPPKGISLKDSWGHKKHLKNK